MCRLLVFGGRHVTVRVWQTHAHGRAVPLPRFDSHNATVVGHDPVDDRQTESRAFSRRPPKRLKDLIEFAGRNANALSPVSAYETDCGY